MSIPAVESDIRSPYCIFLAHCLLAQAVHARGVARHFPAAVKPVVQFCLDHDINMIQMPCPEVLCPAGGLGREPRGKLWYENRGLRVTSRTVAIEQVAYMKQILDEGLVILGIVGLEFSPACAVNLLNRGRRVVRDTGIYIEELDAAMKQAGLNIPFVGVNKRGLKKLAKELNARLPQRVADAAQE